MKNKRIPFSAAASLCAFAVPLLTAPLCSAALVASWALDETAGNIVDQLGGTPPGVATGSPVYGKPGVPNGTYGAITITEAGGTSIGFGPSNEDVFFTLGADNNNPVMNLSSSGQLTVMAWVKADPPTVSGASTYRFLSTGSHEGPGRGWGVGLRYSDLAGTNASLRWTNYGVADTDSAVFTATPGDWLHLAVTYDNGAINYFVNGVLTGSQVNSRFGDESDAGRLVIGGRVGGHDMDQMNGSVDGIRVYDSVLSLDDIRAAAVASVSIPEPSLAALCLLGGGLLLRRRRG